MGDFRDSRETFERLKGDLRKTESKARLEEDFGETRSDLKLNNVFLILGWCQIGRLWCKCQKQR